MNPTPLLLISDAVTAGTGLARITRDLATRIATNLSDVIRVGTLGYGGLPSRSLPFPQYPWNPRKDWMIPELPDVWQDFAGDEAGIIMTVWDSSRLLWFSRPENCQDERLKKFLTNPATKKWGYFPIDATGPHDRLTAVLTHIIEGYDRVLAYSKWAEDILRRSMTSQPLLDGLTNLPHGIDTSVFHPRHRLAARHGFGERIGAKTQKGKWLAIPDDHFLIGIVATNQARKDFGLGISAVAEIAKERKVMLWIHTDTLERHWSIPALLNDFGLLNNTVITLDSLSDEQMSWSYSACDVTLGIGLGEGYGLPLFESLACGTPCIHGNYGGAPEHMHKHMLVEPNYTFRIEGIYNCLRPVFLPDRWAGVINYVSDNEVKAELPSHLDWNNLWPRWAEWLTKGLPNG